MAVARKTSHLTVAPAAKAVKPAKAALKAPAAAPVAPVTKTAKGKGKAAAAAPEKSYAPIPADALIVSTGEKTAFIATYTSFVDDKGVTHNSIVFTKGYQRADGALTMTGRSGTFPQSALKGVKGKALAKQIYDWLLTFNR